MNRSNLLITSFIATWAILTGIGFVWLTDYSARPGKPANVSHKLPKGIFAEPGKNLPKLLLFIHPRCPCSRATLNELARLVADRQASAAEIRVFFYKPADKPGEWVETDLWENAKSIPGVEVSLMSEEEIEKFGVVTSGQAILYDAAEEIVFSGGITVGRGHEGKSLGRAAIENYLENGEISIRETPVFGCLLTSKEIVLP